MATPKGMHAQRIVAVNGDTVHVYSNSQRIVLQLRHEAPTETDLMSPSFKVAVNTL